MSGILSPSPTFQTFTQNGAPNAFGTLATYAAGTSTPIATYTDSTLATPNPNPLTFNAIGQAVVWLTPGLSYKFTWFDQFGNQIDSRDQINAAFTLNNSLIPANNNVLNVGSPTFQWANGYFGTAVYVNGSPVPTFARTPDEVTASITPSNYNYQAGNLLRYGADPTGIADSTVAIQAAAAVQAVSNREIVVDGIFAYTPTARIDIKGMWRGSGKVRSAIHVNTGSFSGDYFRVTGHGVLRDLTIQATTGTGVGTGVYLSNDPDTAFTGDIRVSGVNIVGFNIGLSIGNVYKALLDRVDMSGNNYGEYCVPNPTGGGYCNLVQHLNCDIYNNGVNVYFNPSVNCNEIAYYNCAIEDATGTTLVSGQSINAYFANVATLRMHSTYCEGAAVTYAFYFASVSNLDLIGMDNSSNGQILIANTNTVANLIGVISSAALAAGGSSTPVNLLLLNCGFPASGNTYNLLTSIILNTNINTTPSTNKVNYLSLNGNQVAGWGTPTGAAVVNNFSGAAATLVQCSNAIAEIITTLKSAGFFGA